MPGIVLDTGNTVVNKTKSRFHGTHIAINKHILSGRNKIKGDERLESHVGGGVYILDKVTVAGGRE